MRMTISFPGGMKVNAEFHDHIVRTDQALRYGGENSAPAPFDLFLASIGTCAGFFVARFCEKRGLPPEGIQLELETAVDPETRMLSELRMFIRVPSEFPEKYYPALIRSADQCPVKKAIMNPPKFSVEVIPIPDNS